MVFQKGRVLAQDEVDVSDKAVLLRPGIERFNVTEALQELLRFSLVDQIFSEEKEEAFVGVPLAAAMYGRSKLEVSPLKAEVEEDRKLLRPLREQRPSSCKVTGRHAGHPG